MYEYLPIIIIVAIVGSFTILFLLADMALRRVKKDISTEKYRKCECYLQGLHRIIL